jgi:hypothetical protein
MPTFHGGCCWHCQQGCTGHKHLDRRSDGHAVTQLWQVYQVEFSQALRQPLTSLLVDLDMQAYEIDDTSPLLAAVAAAAAGHADQQCSASWHCAELLSRAAV